MKITYTTSASGHAVMKIRGKIYISIKGQLADLLAAVASGSVALPRSSRKGKS